MPPNFGTILDDSTKLDIVTYILQTNGYPAGARAFPHRSLLGIGQLETHEIHYLLDEGSDQEGQPLHEHQDGHDEARHPRPEFGVAARQEVGSRHGEGSRNG